jgi:hypothetical protein
MRTNGKSRSPSALAPSGILGQNAQDVEGDGSQGGMSAERKQRAFMMAERLVETDQSDLVVAVINVFYEHFVERAGRPKS